MDAYRFEQLISTGRRLLAGQNPPAARDHLTRALTLWHGAPYAEFHTHPSIADESARLEQMRLTALESSAEPGSSWGGPPRWSPNWSARSVSTRPGNAWWAT